MTPERWRQITGVFHEALARDPASRGAFLDGACTGDPALRAEVSTLLAAHRGAGPFGESPLVDLENPVPTVSVGEHTIAPDDDRDDDRTDEVGSAPADSPRSRHLFFWLVCVASIATVAAFAYAASLLVLNGGATPAFGWYEERRADAWVVTTVDPDGPAAGLVETGDRILSLNDVPAAARAGTRPHRRRLSIGDAYRLVVDRQGDRRELTLTASADPDELVTRLVYFVGSLVWCIVGLFIGAARPQQPVARLASGAAVMTGLNFLNGIIQIGPLFHPMHVVVGSHFFCRFPSGRPVSGIWKRILVVMYGAAALIMLLNVVVQTIRLTLGVAGIAAFQERYEPWLVIRGTVPLVVFYASLILMVTAAARNYRLLREEDERRRFRWVAYGSIVALTPQIVWSLADYVVSPESAARLGLPANLFTVGIPLVVAYAVVRHRVFDISVVVRRGLQYLLAQRALQALTAVPIAVLLYTVVSNQDKTIAQLAATSTGYLYWSGAAALTLRFRRPVSGWLDRRFFREEFDREQLLLELLDDLTRAESMSEVSELVNASLESAFHPKAVHLWHRNLDRLELGYSSDPHLKSGVPVRAQLLAWLEGHSRVIGLPPPASAGLSRADASWLTGLGATLMVPIADSADRLLGVWLLGEKRSEEPYSANDRRLLEAIAKQAAVVSENLRLKVQVGEEQRIRHDVLARLDDRQASVLKECPSCGACFDAPADRCDRDGHSLVLSLPVGRTVDARYRLDQLIGKGGMGAVYEARDLQLERSVAVKIMLGRSFGDQRTLRRFRREARTAAQLNHPNIVAVYDAGRLDADGAYLVMERVHGVTLRSELQRAGWLPPSATADWFDQLLDGVSAAHDRGIVHRDLKPENIIGTRTGGRSLVVKILDFGLAKPGPDAPLGTVTLTTDGAVMGTLGYMAPEQLLGRPIDRRADVFAVGVMLAEVLTGRRPFEGSTYGDFLQAALHGEYHLPGSAPEIRVVDDLLQRCLSKDPQDRLSSAAELQQSLIPALRNLAASAPDFRSTPLLT